MPDQPITTDWMDSTDDRFLRVRPVARPYAIIDLVMRIYPTDEGGNYFWEIIRYQDRLGLMFGDYEPQDDGFALSVEQAEHDADVQSNDYLTYRGEGLSG
jgi:hypothetical protein